VGFEWGEWVGIEVIIILLTEWSEESSTAYISTRCINVYLSLGIADAMSSLSFGRQKKVTKENSRLRLPLLMLVLLVGSVLTEPDDAGFWR
jgi:hypothetical protein